MEKRAVHVAVQQVQDCASPCAKYMQKQLYGGPAIVVS
jgi:hypothetical protein